MRNKNLNYLNNICSRHTLWALIIGVGYFILNYLQTSPYNVGYADSDELLTVAFNKGLAHPPGYPLSIFLLNLFFKLPLNEASIAFKGHLLSNLTSSVALAIVFLSFITLYSLLDTTQFKKVRLFSKTFESWWYALISTLSLAFVFQFWLYSHIAEKYSLAALFTAIWMFLTIKIISKKTVPILYWILYAIVLGISISHLQSLILLIPSSIYLFYQKKSTNWQKEAAISLLVLVSSFTIPFLFLFYFHSKDPLVSWSFIPTPEGLVNFITRQDFAGLRYASGQEAGAYFDTFDINKFTHGVLSYLKILISHAGWWSLILIFLALRFGHHRLKSNYWILATTTLLLTIGLAGYLGFPEDAGSQAITLRQYIPGFVLLSSLFYFGWYEVSSRLLVSGKILFPRGIYYFVLSIPIVLISFHAISNYPHADLSNYDLISKRYQEMMQSFDKNSVVTCYSDVSCFALLYEKYVNQNRTDITIVPMAHPLVEKSLNDPHFRLFAETYTSNPYLTLDAITSNLGKTKVYAVELSTVYYNLLGLGGPFMYYVPYTSYGQLTFDLPEELPTPGSNNIEAWNQLKTSSQDPMREFHKSTISRDFIINGTMYQKMDHRDWALQEFNRASNIIHQISPSDQEQFTALRNQLEHLQPEENYSPGTSIPTVEELLEPIQDFYDNNQLRRAFTYAHASMARDPQNITARIWLGKIYEGMGDLDFAKLEFKNVLIIDPNNQEAKDNLNRLSPEFNL